MNKYKMWLEERIIEHALDEEMYREQGNEKAVLAAWYRGSSYQMALEAYNRMYQQDYQAAKRKKEGKEEKKR